MTRQTNRSSGSVILWASAFLLGGMIIMKAGELPANRAFASDATAGGTFSMATVSKGTGPEVRPHELLVVADNRGEMLYIYEVEDSTTGRRVLLRGGGALPNLFRVARGR